MPTTRQIDPSRTVTIRRAFSTEMTRRFKKISKAIKELIVRDDAFAIKKHPIAILEVVPPRVYEFLTDSDKIREFRRWLKEMVDKGILESDLQRRPWMAKYIDSAFKKGKTRSYREKYGKLAETQAPLLGINFIGPTSTATLEFIYTRAYNDLQGITDEMATRLSRILAQGFAEGRNPLEIASEMTKNISGLTKNRAVLIARTETIAAHAEGQLEAYRELQVPEVIVEAEWQTAGDDRVCPACEAMEGRVFDLEEARWMLPLHPSCRCAWAPMTRMAPAPKG